MEESGSTFIDAVRLQMGLDDSDRIVFTDPVSRRLHLHVKALADVFIDTPQYNGHGTATDALWAKIPLVTVRHALHRHTFVQCQRHGLTSHEKWSVTLFMITSQYDVSAVG